MSIKKFKPFNLEAALDGKPCVSKAGYFVKIIGYNEKVGDFPVAGWLTKPDGTVTFKTWTTKGYFLLDRESDTFDLYMPPVKVTKEGWMNVYPEGDANCNTVYPTKEDADLNANKFMRIDCIKIVYTYEE